MAAEVRAADLPEGLPIAGRDAMYIKAADGWKRIDEDNTELKTAFSERRRCCGTATPRSSRDRPAVD